MCRWKLRWLIAGVGLAAGLLAIGSAARAWQAPGELPHAPRVFDVEELYLGDAEDVAADLADEAIIPDIEPAAAPVITPQHEETSPDDGNPISSRRVRAATSLLQPDATQPRHAPPAVPADIDLPDGPATPLAPVKFKQIEPGRTTLDELTSLWGQPLRQDETASGTLLSFPAEPFQRIDAVVNDGRVTSLVVYLPKPAAPQPIVKRLALAELAPLELTDDAGNLIGHRFPERGITLGFNPLADPPRVAHFLLEPLAAEPFVLRVKADRRHQWQQNLDDLQTAIWLNQRDDRAWWLQGELLFLQGKDRAAAASLTQAIRLQPQSQLYQIAGARIIAAVGEHGEAAATARAVLEDEAADPLLRARAAALWGDLTAAAPPYDYQQALARHQQAIKLALPLASDAQAEVRRAAKRVLIDAHIAVANDIARGRWQKKEQIVPQWLDRGQALVDEMLANDDGHPLQSLELNCRRLEAFTWLEGKVDPDAVVQQTQALAQKITEQATDELFRRHVAWQLGKALVDAVDTQRARGHADKALATGLLAEAALAPLVDAGWRGDEAQFQLSRLYFLLGSIHAVHRKDHAAAVGWFEKAVDRIARPEPDLDLRQTARRGEWLVSMGLSYWRQNDKPRGLKLTELGAALIEGAHGEQAIGQEKLAAPYNNLAFMYGQLGEDDKAKQYSEMAAKVKSQVRQR